MMPLGYIGPAMFARAAVEPESGRITEFGRRHTYAGATHAW